MRMMTLLGSVLCFLAVCALEGNAIGMIPAVGMVAVGMPMVLIGAFKSGICE